jgi:hypothetical protein
VSTGEHSLAFQTIILPSPSRSSSSTFQEIVFFQGIRKFVIAFTNVHSVTLSSPHFLFYLYIYIYIYIYRFKIVFLRCPTPRLNCFLSSHLFSFRFLSFMAFLIPSIQFFFGLHRALFCFGIHFSAILGNLPPAILWTCKLVLFNFFYIFFTSLKSNLSIALYHYTRSQDRLCAYENMKTSFTDSCVYNPVISSL